MDKNMINIDDLVRLKLAGGEEKERPGAWLQMRELLDKEMPVQAPPAVFNWRRTLSAAALLLALGTVTIGGYQLYNNRNANTNSNNGTPVVVAPNMHAINNAPASNSAPVNNNTSTGSASTNNTLINNNEPGNGHDNQPQHIAVSSATGGANKSTTEKRTAHHSTKGSVAVNNIASQNEATGNTTSAENTIANNTAAQPKQTSKKNHSNNVFASAGKLPANGLNKPAKHSGNNNGTGNGIAKGNKENKNNSRKGTAPVNNPSSTYTPPVYNTGNNGVTNPANFAVNTPREKRRVLDYHKTNPRYVDSINFTYVQEKSRRGAKRIDTIDKGLMAVNQNEIEPASAASGNAAANAEVNPAANSSIEDVKLTRAERRAERNKYEHESIFERMVENAKVNFNEVSFHPGLMFGVSSTMGKYNMFGVQGGFSGSLNLSERWGIFAELKYLYRFGNGKSLANNYNSIDQAPPQYISPNYFRFTVDSQEHSFNISSSGLVELPLAVRYRVQKLNFFAGVDLAYNFAVNVEERFDKLHTSYYYGNNTESLQNNWKNNNDPKLTPAEFGSRFSMGYMFGVGYQVSPVIGLDLRATQVFWDNGKVHSEGAYFVSKQMYRSPCVQFNLTYSFIGNKNGPMKAR